MMQEDDVVAAVEEMLWWPQENVPQEHASRCTECNIPLREDDGEHGLCSTCASDEIAFIGGYDSFRLGRREQQ